MIAHVTNDVQAGREAKEHGDVGVPAALAGATVDVLAWPLWIWAQHVVSTPPRGVRSGRPDGCWEQVQVATIEMGTSRSELLQAMTAYSAIGRFIGRRGEGMQPLALRVGSVDVAFQRVQEAGLRRASDSIRVGVGGRYLFVHPANGHDVLFEIVGQGSAVTEAG